MQGTENFNERILLEYGYGRAVLGKVRCAGQSFINEDGNRFWRAQAIAQLQDPELNEMISRTLMHLQLIASLIEERKALWRDIERRERARREAGVADYDQDPLASEDAMLFERLMELCQKVSLVRKGEMPSL
jgi:G:T/U-mismatch repair DNA glycosylase